MRFTRRRAAIHLFAIALSAALGAGGCSSGDDRRPPAPPDDTQVPEDLISATPRPGNVTDPSSWYRRGPEERAATAIAEARFVELLDDRLYALSEYSGLSVIDVAAPDALVLLGQYRGPSGTPFEIHLRDGVVYALFSGVEQAALDEDGDPVGLVRGSRIEVLDASVPSDIRPLAAFDVPGDVSDSRMVGDVLYVVTYEDGRCWGCGDTPRTVVTSFDVAGPASVAVVDQLDFATPEPNPWGADWRRSVAATPERLYIAGVEYGGSPTEGSSIIQVVDVSDPGGHLALGASLPVAGEIRSRWQMDEYQGVLRVISQPGEDYWFDMPAVQTFSVVSSQEIQPLGSIELQIPDLQLDAVRFDGSRAFVTSLDEIQATGHLTAVDLSTPAQPAMMGTLELSGRVDHLEPRGDRLLALGSSLSLLDVSDLAQVTLLDRVDVGGPLNDFDEDRRDELVTLLDDLGLILAPIGSFPTGVQLIDVTADDLTLRGVAPLSDRPRRALVQDGRLLAVSSTRVGAFDIGDRDAPLRIAERPLASRVDRAVVVGEVVARVADWPPRLEVVPLEGAGGIDPLGALDLQGLVNDGTTCDVSFEASLFAVGQLAVLVAPIYGAQADCIVTVDLADPAHPAVAGHLTLPGPPGLYLGKRGVVAPGPDVVQVGQSLVRLHREWQPSDDVPEWAAPEKARLEVVDLSDPARPLRVASLALPEGAGHAGLRAEGDHVLVSRWVPLADDPRMSRFYLDRIDLSSPDAPVALPPVNVPGSPIALDDGAGRLLTVDYRWVSAGGMTELQCWYEHGPEGIYDPAPAGDQGTCSRLAYTLKLLELGASGASLVAEERLGDGTSLDHVVVGDERVFLQAHDPRWYAEDGYLWWRLLVLGDLRGDALDPVTIPGDDLGYRFALTAVGTQLVLDSRDPPAIWTLDAADLGAMSFEFREALPAEVRHAAAAGDVLLCSMEEYGLEAVDLSQ